MRFSGAILAFCVMLPAASVVAADSPPVQTDFPPEEFQARWAIVYDRIGDHGVAMIQGAPKANGFLVPRQSNEFYYLCGIEAPHAYLVLDGRDRKATLFLPPRDARLESAEGKVIAEQAQLATHRGNVTIAVSVVSQPYRLGIARPGGRVVAQKQVRLAEGGQQPVIAVLAGVAVALIRPKSIDSAVLGSNGSATRPLS